MGGGSNRQSMYPPPCQSESTARDRPRPPARDREALAFAGNLTLSSGSASLEVSMQNAATEQASCLAHLFFDN